MFALEPEFKRAKQMKAKPKRGSSIINPGARRYCLILLNTFHYHDCDSHEYLHTIINVIVKCSFQPLDINFCLGSSLFSYREAYSEPSQTSKLDLSANFCKKIHLRCLTVF